MVTILIREAIKKIMLGSEGCSSGVRIFSDFFLEAFLGFIYLEKNMISEEEKTHYEEKDYIFQTTNTIPKHCAFFKFIVCLVTDSNYYMY